MEDYCLVIKFQFVTFYSGSNLHHASLNGTDYKSSGGILEAHINLSISADVKAQVVFTSDVTERKHSTGGGNGSQDRTLGYIAGEIEAVH